MMNELALCEFCWKFWHCSLLGAYECGSTHRKRMCLSNALAFQDTGDKSGCK